MFTKEDILKRMTAGDSIDDIAQEVSAILNAANDEFEAKKVASQKEAKKADIIKEINNLVIAYADLVDPKAADAMREEGDANIEVLTKSFDEMFKLIGTLNALNEQIAAKPASIEFTSDDDVLKNFIASLCD